MYLFYMAHKVFTINLVYEALTFVCSFNPCESFSVLPILLPAIVVINFLNLTLNGYYSMRVAQGKLVAAPDKGLLKKYKKSLAIN